METTELLRRVQAVAAAGDELPTAELTQQLAHCRALVTTFQAHAARLAGLLSQRASCPEVARSDERRAKELQALPAVRSAWESGELSTSQVETLLSLQRRLPANRRRLLRRQEAELTGKAAELDLQAFRTHCLGVEAEVLGLPESDVVARRRRHRRGDRFERPEGMGELRLLLDPIAKAKVWSALDARCAHLAAQRRDDKDPDTSEELLLVDAAVDLLTGRASTGVPVAIIRDPGPKRAGSCTATDGTPIPAADVATEFCDSDLDIVRCDAEWQPLDLGRLHRSATPAQRQALRVMYPTCAFPGCSRPFERCHVHHYDHWADGHPTNLSNLGPYCTRHHGLFHQGWTAKLNPDGSRTLRTPSDEVHATLPRPRAGPAG